MATATKLDLFASGYREMYNNCIIQAYRTRIYQITEQVISRKSTLQAHWNLFTC